MSAQSSSSTNLWQRGVRVFEVRMLTRSTLALLAFAAIGMALAVLRLFGGLGRYSGMNDIYAWGVWKTFNVMTLTALGSGGLAVGAAAWILDRKRLHVVMRTALVTSFLFYTTGLAALAIDVGRPWNFWNLLLPTHWNEHSPLFEVSLAMPLYCVVFLGFENSPAVVEHFWYRGSPRARRVIRAWQPRMRRIYPYMVGLAYLLPLGHQSSLGALLLLSGGKLDPLWQTPMLPLLYLIQAFACGFAFVMFIVMASCVTWRRPLDMAVIGELGNLLSWTSIVWLTIRFGDLALRHQLGAAFRLDVLGELFWLENVLIGIPALVLRRAAFRGIPRLAFLMAVMACGGGMLYRFTPTTLSFDQGHVAVYFPSVPELLISMGFIALALSAFVLTVKWLAILPAPLSTWRRSIAQLQTATPHIARDSHGNPTDD
ncbi:MAG: nickel-dependent hydrogenase, rane protein [Labilithrix sp.]|nr:nickel-dependent hydrogenase, rane protein [Labilithrix sp.]